MANSYTVVLEKSDNGYAAYLPDLPGCVAAGDTVEETKALIAEAVASHLELLASESSRLAEAHRPYRHYKLATEGTYA